MKGGLGGEAPQKKKTVLKEHAEVYKFRKIFEGGEVPLKIFWKLGLEGGV